MLRRLSMRLLPRRPAGAERGQRREGRRGNQRLVRRVQVRHFLLQRSIAGLAEQGFELGDGVDGVRRGHGGGSGGGGFWMAMGM
jgi:hypothetical protein